MHTQLFILFFLFVSSPMLAQELLFLDSSSGKPIEGVVVRDMESVFMRISSEQGLVSLDSRQLKKDSLVLTAQLLGYQSLRFELRTPYPAKKNIYMHTEGARLPEFVVAAIRMEEKSAGTFSTVKQSDINRFDLGQDLPYLIQFTPSVQINSDAGAGIGYTNLWIRGSDATRINVTLNGVPLNDSESQGLFWVNMPDLAASVDEIQIQRGIGSSTNGAASFGASMNINTTHSIEKPFTEAMFSYGSYNTSRIRLATSTGKLPSGFDLQFRLSSVQSQGFIDRGRSDLVGGFISSGYEKKNYSIRANALLGSEKTYQCWYGIPESKLENNPAAILAFIERNQLNKTDSINLMDSNPRTYNYYTYDNQIDNYKQNHYQLIQTYRPSDAYWATLTLHGTTGKGYFEEFKSGELLANYGLSSYVSGNDTLVYDDVVRQRWLDNYFLGAILSMAYTVNPRLRFISGLSANSYSGRHFGKPIKTTLAGNLVNPDNYYENEAVKQEQSGFIKVEWQKGRIKLFGDLQYRMVQYRYQAFANSGSLTTAETPSAFFNPKAGMTYQLTDAFQGYLCFGRAGKEPVRDDYVNSISGSSPIPEYLEDYEAGIRYNTTQWNVELNYFFMKYINQLVLTGAVNDVGAYVRSNVPRSYRQGIELACMWQPVAPLRITGNATWAESRSNRVIYYLDDYGTGERTQEIHENRLLAFSPTWNLNGLATYKLSNRIELGYNWKYNSAIYLDNTQNEERKLNPYHCSGLSIQWNPSLIKSRITLRAQINNLFNQAYETNGYTYSYSINGSMTTENFYYPQAGINWLASISLKI